MDFENKHPSSGPVHGGERSRYLFAQLVRHYLRARLAAQPRVCTTVQVFTVTGEPAVQLFMQGYMNGQ
jgi:hypothetical protein